MVQLSSWQPVHIWLVKKRLGILLLFKALILSVVVLIISTFFLIRAESEWYLILYNTALQAGTVSAYLYLCTLIPGILKRFNIFTLFRTSAMLFRRQFGILMFLLAIFHQATLVSFPMIINFGRVRLELLAQREVYGLVAMCLLFPMWLTSNDVAVKKLGPWWNWIHRLTYIALFFIYIHVAVVSDTLRWLFMGMMIAVTISWVYFWLVAKKKVSNEANV